MAICGAIFKHLFASEKIYLSPVGLSTLNLSKSRRIASFPNMNNENKDTSSFPAPILLISFPKIQIWWTQKFITPTFSDFLKLDWKKNGCIDLDNFSEMFVLLQIKFLWLHKMTTSIFTPVYLNFDDFFSKMCGLLHQLGIYGRLFRFS